VFAVKDVFHIAGHHTGFGHPECRPRGSTARTYKRARMMWHFGVEQGMERGAIAAGVARVPPCIYGISRPSVALKIFMAETDVQSLQLVRNQIFPTQNFQELLL
jgi:hypothetical protein